MENREVARILRETAQLLEIDGAMIGRYRSYERAAELIDSLPESVEELAQDPQKARWNCPASATAWPSTSRKSSRPATTPCARNSSRNIPQRFSICSTCNRSDPRKSRFSGSTFKAGTVEQVEKLAREGKLRDLPGFGEKSEENILKAIEVFKKSAGRFLHRLSPRAKPPKLVALHPQLRQAGRLGHAGRLAAARQGDRRRPRPAGHASRRASTPPPRSKRSPSTSWPIRKSSRCWRTAKTKSAFA